ncbi:1-phosphofructokinase family hexose kinase [Methylomarinum sp. Ch1-1]|uniref:Phosphofructokinase n=1 Tax=Methylomarinum roseum TaxID=3067653 RepID=A0AAU7NZ75_9GAMM|nr:1-phosphofructokinase family hexose kinase [Methylomarinum sp. Ch1-1]MDP4521694.1 1-phosphofructokinase family hexose kinase [Methylomarinum sp. Ch1-1]
MSRIISVTANTAIDFFIEVEGLCRQDNIQARSSREFACGKGINVARGLASLQTPVTCVGFVGRQSWQVFSELISAGLNVDFTAVDGKTRTNITLSDAAERRETHIRTAGFCVSADDCRLLSAKLDDMLAAGDLLILSGSLPGGADDLYRSLIELCHAKGVMAFLDSSGNGLRTGLAAKPYLIKPNLPELEEIAGESLVDEQAIVAAARRIVEQGVDWVCVSRGDQGLVVVGREVSLAACVQSLPGDVVSHIGCGDALVAGLAAATLHGKPLEEVVKTAVSCATGNLFSSEPGGFSQSLQQAIEAQVDIRSLAPLCC